VLDVNQAAILSENVADLHLVRTIVVDEFLVEAETPDGCRGFDVVGVFVGTAIGIGKTAELA
jgi:hypothetical protein